MSGANQQVQAKKSPGIRNLGFAKVGTIAGFVLLNGFVLAALAFLMIRFTVNDMKRMDAVTSTRDVMRATELAVKDFEKTANALSVLYTSAQAGNIDPSSLTQQSMRLMAGHGAAAGIVWATDRNVWRYDSATGTNSAKAYTATSGMPSYEDIDAVAGSVEFNRPRYLAELPWTAFKSSNKDRQLGALIVKSRMPDGSVGYMMLVSPIAKTFGEVWVERYDMIASVQITERDTGKVIIDEKSPAKLSGFNNATAIKNALQIGDRYFDIVFNVRPMMMSSYLEWSPWGIAALIAVITILTSIVAQKKNQQDEELAEMSETLEDAHHELQSKTSERDQLFHALRKSERENRAVINSVSDVIFETDENGRIIFLNETWKRMMPRDVKDVMGHSLFSLLEKSDQERQKEFFEQLVRGERQAYREETRIDLGNGMFKPVEIAFSMLRMAEDKRVRVVGTITDIEKRRRAETALRAAEQRFRSIFENSLSGIYQTSPDGKFLNANPALAEMLGYASAEEMIVAVNDIGRELYANPADRQHFVSKLMFEGRISGYESQIRRKDGKLIWILENARVVHSDKGGVAYFEGSVSEITEHKEAEEAVRQARIQAEISSRSRMEFLSNMSHELRTPLNAVIGFSEIIKDELLGPVGVKEYKEYAQDIYNSGNGLLRVISEILEVSKIATGHRELNISTFKLSRAIKSCMIIMGTRIQQAGVEVNIEIPDDLPELMAEELGMKQVLMNLVSNAVKFSKAGGGGKVDITASVEPTGEMYIDVVDNGIGMTADEIRRAMEPFAKVDMSFGGMKEGTGLGLTIADSIVKLHGAQLQLISEKGRGTTARIIMPAFRVMTPNEGVDTHHLKVIK